MTGHKAYMNGVLIDYAISNHIHTHEHLTKIGNKKKSYKIGSKVRWKITSACSNMWNRKKHKLTFWTFTIPANSDLGRNGSAFNKIFGAIIENLKKTHDLAEYVWVRERHTLNHTDVYHYHALFDVKFIDIKTINSYYEKAITDFCIRNNYIVPDFCGCSVRLPDKYDRNGNKKGAVVRDLRSVIKYISKYISKSIEGSQAETSRVYAFSRGISDTSQRITQQAARLLRSYTTHSTECEFFTITYTDTDRLDQITNIINENIYSSVTDLIHKEHRRLQTIAQKNTVRIEINKKKQRISRLIAIEKHRHYCRLLRSINGRFLIRRQKAGILVESS